MLRRLLPFVLVALVAAPTAFADGAPVSQAAAGVRLLRARSLRGAWGIRGVTLDRTPGGLSGDGGTLVLTRPPTSARPTWSDFQVVRTRDLAPVQRVRLRGSFSYDALS